MNTGRFRKIQGRITPKKTGRSLQFDTKVTINIVDISLADAPAEIIALHEFNNPKNFPISFEFDYDDEPIRKMPAGRYAIQVTISTNDRIDYFTESSHSIVNLTSLKYNDYTILETVDIEVVPCD